MVRRPLAIPPAILARTLPVADPATSACRTTFAWQMAVRLTTPASTVLCQISLPNTIIPVAEIQKPDASTYVRGSCTDQSWESPECPRFCINSTLDDVGGGEGIAKCPNTSLDLYYCIDGNYQEANCTSGNLILSFAGKFSMFHVMTRGMIDIFNSRYTICAYNHWYHADIDHSHIDIYISHTQYLCARRDDVSITISHNNDHPKSYNESLSRRSADITRSGCYHYCRSTSQCCWCCCRRCSWRCGSGSPRRRYCVVHTVQKKTKKNHRFGDGCTCAHGQELKSMWTTLPFSSDLNDFGYSLKKII